MYICKHFKIGELVPPEAIVLYKDNIWGQLTENIKITADAIREHFGREMSINNKYMKYRGLRTSNSSDYNPKSQHSIGNAIDFTIEDFTPSLIRYEILSNPDIEAFKLIGGVEDFKGMTWVHVDCRPRSNGKILVFNKG